MLPTTQGRDLDMGLNSAVPLVRWFTALLGTQALEIEFISNYREALLRCNGVIVSPHPYSPQAP